MHHGYWSYVGQLCVLVPDGPSYRADTLTKAMLPKEAHFGASTRFFGAVMAIY